MMRKTPSSVRRRSTPTAAVLACLLAFAASSSFAAPEEAEEEPSAAARYDEHVATLPAPPATHAFRFEGELVLNGERQGRSALEANVREEDGTAVGWSVEDTLVFEREGAGTARLQARADLGRDLEALRGVGVSSMLGSSRTHVWERTPRGVRIETTWTPATEGGAAPPADLDHPGSLISTWSGVVLLARSLLDLEGAFETTLWAPLEKEKVNALTTLRLTPRGVAPWRGGSALIVQGERRGQRLVFAFDSDTRAFLGAELAAGRGLVIAFLPPGAGRDPAPEAAVEGTGAGQRLLDVGEMAKALEAFDGALALAPDHVPALLGRARALYYLGRFDEALAELQRVVELAPLDPAPHELLGLVHERQGQPEKAVEAYTSVVELDPEGPHTAEMIARRGHARLLAGDLAGAEADYDRALETSPETAVLWRGRGIVRERAGNLDGAILDFEKACALDPSSPQDWFNLGLTLMRAKKPQRAVAAFGAALERAQPHPLPLVRRAVARLEAGDEAGWLADLFAAARLAPKEPAEVWPPSLRTDLAYAAAIAAEGQPAVASRVLAALRAREDLTPAERARALLWEWVAHAGTGTVNPVAMRIRELLDEPGVGDTNLWEVALLRAAVGEAEPAALRQAAEAVGTSREARAGKAEAVFVEGVRALSMGKTETARALFAEALALDAETTPAWFAAGVLLGRLDGTEDAAAVRTD